MNSERKEVGRLPTNCVPLDRLLHGGIPSSQLTVIYGEAATGKTTLALQASIASSRMGLRVVYVDADGRFPVERFRQLAYDFEDIAPLIDVFTPKNFFEQTILIENLEFHLNSKVGLIVFDTINSLYRLARENAETTFLMDKELNRQLAYLTSYAKTYRIPVVLTSQVHSVPDASTDEKVEPVATRTLKFWGSTLIHLKLANKPNLRLAVLERFEGRRLPNVYCYFKLSSHGIE